ncbi:hypothetical protein [Cellvibrio sp. pealriver]|uniref:hypothetical protein n=1 Tax=Cellvibrio sp. pealriver TaxID=1622269 RepID=UPI0012E0D653|nr:hypothetical protein [Cellvibrio sp. pealriver]
MKEFHSEAKEMDEPQVKIEVKREVRTYAEFWHTSTCLLEMTNEIKEGQYHLVMGSLVFTAFTLEAFLNHAGEKVFSCWKDLERLSPKEKLNVISEKIELKIDYGVRPWQLINELFQFRNDIAHGKNITLKLSDTKTLTNYRLDPNLQHYNAETRWEKYCTKENAERARSEVIEIVELIYNSAKISNEYPFQFGFEMKGSTLVL